MTSSECDLGSIDELEKALKTNPNDHETEYALAQALFDRFAYEGGGDEDLRRMKEIVDVAPNDRLRYERAFLALLYEDTEVAVQQITDFGKDISTRDRSPIDVDEFWEWLGPVIDIAPVEFFRAFADGLAEGWPESAAVPTLRGIGEADTAKAIKHLEGALAKDPTFWVADYVAGDAYYDLKDWVNARDYFTRALRSDDATQIPDIYFCLAWCYGTQKDFDKEAASYKKCLELDPDFPDARNNLGWSLMKAHKYEQAISVFNESIKRGNDGKRPLRNLAEVLKRLGRYEEAIQVLHGDTVKGKLTSFSQQKIAAIKALQRAKSDRVQGGNKPTKGNTMQIDMGTLDQYRERFLESMLDFVDFSLKSGRYWDEERAYKEEISALTQQLLAPSVFEASDARDEVVYDAVRKIFTKKLETIERPQNIVGWREADALRHYGPAEKKILAAELGSLLYGSGDLGDRIDTFNTKMWPVFKGTGRANPYARSRLIPTFFLMMIDPANNISVRTDLFKTVSEALIGRSILHNAVFTGAEYRDILDLSKLVYGHLERWGWCPADMIDVHSFLWTAAWEYDDDEEEVGGGDE